MRMLLMLPWRPAEEPQHHAAGAACKRDAGLAQNSSKIVQSSCRVLLRHFWLLIFGHAKNPDR
jgi:hypothetical protein